MSATEMIEIIHVDFWNSSSPNLTNPGTKNMRSRGLTPLQGKKLTE